MMERATWTYFIILGLSLLYPLAQSFEKRVYMYRKMRFIFPGIFAIGTIYILWDVWFTKAGIWGFNHSFTRDFYLFGLPAEEWLFFLVVPYCCFFLFEVLRLFVKRFYHPVLSRITIIALLVLLVGSLPWVFDQTYTFITFSFTALVLLLQLILKTYNTWFSGFLIMYMVSLIPFMVVNGFLTSIPVVWYDNLENLGRRIYTVPVDDFIYLLGMLLPAMNIYQFLLKRYAGPRLRNDMKLDELTGF